MDLLFLSCLKASELIEKKFHVKLSFTERIQLKAHTMMCDACTAYEKQSLILEKGIEQFINQNENPAELKELKVRINTKLRHLNK